MRYPVESYIFRVSNKKPKNHQDNALVWSKLKFKIEERRQFMFFYRLFVISLIPDGKKGHAYLKSDSHLLKKFFYLFQWKTFKSDEKCCLFHLKIFFFPSKIIKFLSWLFGHLEKMLDWKDKVNSNIHDVKIWLANNTNTFSANLTKCSNTFKQSDELFEFVWKFCGIGA